MIEFFIRLGLARVGAIAGTLLLVVGFFIFVLFRATAPEYMLLYGDLDATTVSAMSEKLAEQNVKFELRNGNTEIWVDKNKAPELRISMAGQGLSGTIIGYEIFDRDNALGQSNMVQEVNRLRALEGELSRTVAGIDGVKRARVHIVLPKRELFTRDKQLTKASVTLHMEGNSGLKNLEIKAIQQLISTAVPDLRPENVTIVDNKGRLLHAGGNSDKSIIALTEGNEMRERYEASLVGKVTQILEQTIGYNKVQVEVHAEMDFAEQVENHQTFDPDQQVLASSLNIIESGRSSEGTDGTVTVANNLPDAQQFAAGAGGIQEQSNRSEEKLNFENSTTQRRYLIER